MAEKSIGGFWLKKSKQGKDYYSGQIEINGQKIYIAGFINTEKKDRQPDISIYKSEPKNSKLENDKDDLPF